jgi:acetyl coenzyme A synthetase (ADP forming)-like protein
MGTAASPEPAGVPSPAASTAPAHDGLSAIFAPGSVAVIGASRRRASVGGQVLHNLRTSFRGRTFAVNPRAESIDTVPCFARLQDVPEPIDLAIVTVPGPAVESALDDCIAKGVRAVIVISAGFSETGEAGRARELRLRDKARAAGIRLVGPNCLGALNTDPAVQLNATFSPAMPPAGTVAFSSQSGALGLAVIEYARQLGLGISEFISVGNKADVSTNDLVEYWSSERRTSVILLYVEGFGNPRKFGDIARRVGRRTPIAVLKAGRSSAGARAASSHTGALAASDVMVDALFSDAGVVRVNTLEELFDVAAVFARQPLPAGPRVGIVTNAGGPGILAADACATHGLIVPMLAPSTRDALRACLPPAANISNPVDMIATATADDYERTIRTVLADPHIDSLVVIFTPGLLTDATASARAIARAAAGAPKPVLAACFGAPGLRPVLDAVPSYTFPESAVRALSRAVAYARWRVSPPGELPRLAGFDVAAARAIVRGAAATGAAWLSPAAVSALLQACAIPRVPEAIVNGPAAAADAARRFGYPVVVKGTGPTIVHKTESHAVLTDVRDETSLLAAYERLASRADVTAILLQPMIRGGVEMLVGAIVDPTFGPAVVCGTGGTLVELLGDTSCRLAPVTVRVAAQMLDELTGVVRLRGFRGAPPLAEPALRDVILRVSTLIAACPEIEELDLNPVLVTATDAVALDARVRVTAARVPSPSSAETCTTDRTRGPIADTSATRPDNGTSPPRTEEPEIC